MSNSKLVNYTKISPNSNNPRNHKIDTITIHHMAGNLSIESCGAGFADPKRQASSNYGVGTDGRIGMYVEEANRSWCSSSRENDHRAITIEVANDGGAPNWHVSDKALEATIKLCVDICQRNGIKKLNFTGDKSGNLTMHKWFAATACPGPYLESKFPYIASEVNRRLSEGKNASASANTTTTQKPASGQAGGSLWCVQIGAYTHKKTAEARARSAEGYGFEFSVVQVGGLFKVQSKGYADKAEATALMAKVKKADFTCFLTTRPVEKKTVQRIAQEVIWGLWDVGAERKKKLTAAGYDYNEVQSLVNKMLGK